MKTLNLLALASLGLSTAALAQPAGKGAPATPPTAKTPPAPDAKKAPEPPAAKMEMPKPPKELDDAMKQMTGTWKCTGQAFMDPTAKPTDTKAVITNRADLDKWFMATNFTATMGKMTYKFTGYTTYNTAEKKWYRVMVDNMGSIETNTSTGPAAGKTVWEGESRMSVTMPGMPSNVTKSRHTEEISDKGVHMFGEMSIDGGKTWMKAYDATCKK